MGRGMATLAEREKEALSRVRVEAISEAITQAGGNISKAAGLLGIARQNLYRHAKALGLDLETLRADAATDPATVS